MKKATIWLASVAVVGMLWLGTVEAASALPPRHMPGWDWQRTYPWSPYNYGRNPYNPIIIPYGYPYPYPVPYIDPLPGYVPQPVVETPMPAALTLPSVTGPLTSPPPGTAIIRVRVPAVWAKVRFNGTDTVTSGTQRWFVSPRLADGGATYRVAASWMNNGRPVQAEQTVRVQAGQIRVVDFTGAGTQ